MTERNSASGPDPDELVDVLGNLREGDTATLVTDGGSITATVTATRWHPDGAAVTLADRDRDRSVRVRTEHYDGWLDPLVDAYDDGDPASLRPVGSLVDARLVAAADDRSARHGRP